MAYRVSYKQSQGHYYIYQSGRTESVIKLLGSNKKEQKELADKIVKLLNNNAEK